MQSNWRNSLENLQAYITINPVIEIGKKCTVIPADVRGEFYRLFNTVLTDFIAERFSPQLQNSLVLSKNLSDVRYELSETFGLEVGVKGSTNWFILDPVDGLLRGFTGILFSLLKGDIDPDTFQRQADEKLRQDYGQLFGESYRIWVILSLISSLRPAGVYSVEAKDFYTDPTLSEGDIGPGLHEESVPDAQPTTRISFEQSLLCSFLTPRIIVESGETGRFYAFRPTFYEARWKARRKSTRQEWFDLRQIEREFGKSRLWPDLAVYIADSKDDLDLVADYHYIARPDFIMDIREKAGWHEKGGLETIERHADALQPRLGSAVVCREAAPFSAFEELAPGPADDIARENDTAQVSAEDSASTAEQIRCNIELLDVGDDRTKLVPVIKLLVGEECNKEDHAGIR